MGITQYIFLITNANVSDFTIAFFKDLLILRKIIYIVIERQNFNAYNIDDLL